MLMHLGLSVIDADSLQRTRLRGREALSALRRDKIVDLKHQLGVALKEIKTLRQENKRLNACLTNRDRTSEK
jgi:DNA-binding FadR family transcriptional regulator